MWCDAALDNHLGDFDSYALLWPRYGHHYTDGSGASTMDDGHGYVVFGVIMASGDGHTDLSVDNSRPQSIPWSDRVGYRDDGGWDGGGMSHNDYTQVGVNHDAGR